MFKRAVSPSTVRGSCCNVETTDMGIRFRRLIVASTESKISGGRSISMYCGIPTVLSNIVFFPYKRERCRFTATRQRGRSQEEGLLPKPGACSCHKVHNSKDWPLCQNVHLLYTNRTEGQDRTAFFGLASYSVIRYLYPLCWCPMCPTVPKSFKVRCVDCIIKKRKNKEKISSVKLGGFL